MAKARVVGAVVIGFFLHIGLTSADCDAIIAHGLRNFTSTTSAQDALSVRVHNYCQTDYDKMDQNLQGAVSVDIFGIGGGDASMSMSERKEQLKSWCNQNRSLASSSGSSTSVAQQFYQGALDAWSQCNALDKSLEQSYIISNERHVDISLAARNGVVGIAYLGTEASGFRCKQTKWNATSGAVAISHDQPIVIDTNALKISCERETTALEGNRTKLSEGRIAVRTGLVHDIVISFPETIEPPFDTVTLNRLMSKIEGECLGCVQASILDETSFQSANGKGWVLSKGQSIEGSRLTALTGMKNSPDLRGVFLRGKNYGRFPDIRERVVAEFAQDEVGKHHHEVNDPGHQHPIMVDKPGGTPEVALSYHWSGSHVDAKDQLVKSEKTGISVIDNPGIETIPKNVTINWYIKIN
jgi:hypothetical protein